MESNMNFTDLVLLVGTNPLPNYVVLKYFILNKAPLRRVWLIHSEERAYQSSTKEYAERIRDIVKKESPDIDFQLINLPELSSAQAIQKELEPIFPERMQEIKMHLNYTGGTKTMAVHVYRYLEEKCKEKNIEITFSYLDGRKYALIYDKTGKESNNLLDQIGIRLEDIIYLHKYQRDKEIKAPDYSEALQIINKIVSTNLHGYLCWQQEVLRKYFYCAKNGIPNTIEKTKDFLKNNKIPESLEHSQARIQEMQAEFAEYAGRDIISLIKTLSDSSILDESDRLWIPNPDHSNNDFKRRTKIVKDFLGGKWLEYYVAGILKENLQADELIKNKYNANLIQVESNWEITQGAKPFEIDVILINGYQICGISCTTDQTEPLCKSKAFEILHRTSQFGGEEAKAILITCLPKDKVEDFYEDIKTTSGSPSNKFLVLGQADLQKDKLWEKVRKHIWEV